MICAESGSWFAASSSRTTLTAAMSSEPPASDQTFAFWPPGPTSNMSMSSGHVCEAPVNVTFRSLIVPQEPETTQVDGYGTPFPESGIVIAPRYRSPVAVVVAAVAVAVVAAEAEAVEAEVAAAGCRRSPCPSSSGGTRSGTGSSRPS